MIFGDQVQDIRNAARTAEAVVRFHEKLQRAPRDRNGFIKSRVKTKKISYAYVYHAGPVAGAESTYTVRMGLPRSLKQFAGSRYGISKVTGQPNGFEFVGFETQRDAAEYVKSIADMDYRQFLAWLQKGDGSHKFYGIAKDFSQRILAQIG
jgi:hypothetical protein